MDTRPLLRSLDLRANPGAVRLVLVEAGAELPESPADAPGGGLRARVRGALGRDGSAGPRGETLAYRCADDEGVTAAVLLELLARVESVRVVPSPVPVIASEVARAAELAALCGRPGGVALAEPTDLCGAAELDLSARPVSRRVLLGAPTPDLPEPAESPQRRLVEAVARLASAAEAPASGVSVPPATGADVGDLGDGAGRDVARHSPAAPGRVGNGRRLAGEKRLDRVAQALEDAPLDSSVPATGTPRLRATRCTAAGVCVRVCPHGALRLDQVELAGDAPAPWTTTPAGPVSAATDSLPGVQRQFRLWHSPVDCTGCGRCVEACPTHALSFSGEHTWGELVSMLPADERTGELVPGAPATERPLRAGLVRACVRCGASHAAPGERCPTCEAIVANPFAVRLPPGFEPPKGWR